MTVLAATFFVLGQSLIVFAASLIIRYPASEPLLFRHKALIAAGLFSFAVGCGLGFASMDEVM